MTEQPWAQVWVIMDSNLTHGVWYDNNLGWDLVD